ncbi:hypothetical protein EXN00_13300 [Clostridium botulinum]|uniref:Conserved domain protein n=3 Tax=Clostridium botulinum TaxID=1491 RepID=C1FRD0_CLOBJ|nr:conserved domain protein [Clostridium botulinum A2 str. Kyoto]AUN08888.1 hypothetical protein RSJ14_12390 [Clostridium botulinum]AUN19635.1 hypothetical protein B2M06_11820 [Clostridium botulinum]MBN3364275.1 hypothetical protein [Clostridium botulinum]MBN3368449.1 hypothetical protein [Clostridium botulinum]
MVSQYSIWTKVEKYTWGMEEMKRREVLWQLDSLINNSKSLITSDGDYNSIWEDDIKALKIAKKAVSKEYRYRFWANLVLAIIVLIIFGSFVVMSYFIYR